MIWLKYFQREFTTDIKERIAKLELELKNFLDELALEYKPIFAMKNIDFDAGFERKGDNPFAPGYSSSISIGISDASGNLLDLYLIRIWECEREILGLPILIKVPGSKVIGELLDESLEEVKEELKEYIEELLTDEHMNKFYKNGTV